MAGEMFDPYDVESTDGERRAALIRELMTHAQADEQATAERNQAADVSGALGGLALLSGSRRLAPFGQAQFADAHNLRSRPVGNQGATLLRALSVRKPQAKTPEELEAIAARSAFEREKTRQLGLPKPPKEPKSPPGTSPKDVDALRKEFFSNQIAKDMQNVAVNWGKIQSAAKDPSAAGDIALIYSFMKNQDPGSTVREGEFATAQNAGGVDDRVRAAWNKTLSGERLTAGQRADFLKRSRQAYDAHYSRYRPWADQFTDIAKRRGVNPADVVLDLGFGAEAPAAGGGNFDLTDDKKKRLEELRAKKAAGALK